MNIFRGKLSRGQKIILFDFDGVLVNRFTELSVDDFRVAYGVNRDNFTRVSMEASLGLDSGQKSELDYFTELAKGLALDITPSEMLEFFIRSDEKNIKKNEDIYRWLGRIAEEGVIIGLATNVSKELAERLRKMGLYEAFQRRYFSYEIGATKTDKKFWRHVINDLSVEFEQIIFIDDNQNNLDVALSVGISGFAYSNFNQMLEQVLIRLHQ